MIAFVDTHRHGFPEVKEYHGSKIVFETDTSMLLISEPTLIEQLPLAPDAPEGTEPVNRTFIGTLIAVPIINTDEVTIEPCGPDCFAGHQDEKKYLD